MNGFADHGLDEGAFGEKKGFSEAFRTFDAFRRSYAAILTPNYSQCLLLLTVNDPFVPNSTLLAISRSTSG